MQDFVDEFDLPFPQTSATTDASGRASACWARRNGSSWPGDGSTTLVPARPDRRRASRPSSTSSSRTSRPRIALIQAVRGSADASRMGHDRRVRSASWLAALVAGVIALGATTGVVSITGHPHGDVARAARGPSGRSPIAPGRPAPTSRWRRPPRARRVPRPRHLRSRLDDPPAGARALGDDRSRPPELLGAPVGTLPSSSKYYHVALTAWVEATANHGRWGQVAIPYSWPRRDGWIPLRGLRRSRPTWRSRSTCRGTGSP